MYPRNAASPERIAIGAVVDIATGAVQTTGVSVVVQPEGGAEAAGLGTVAYSAASGVVSYIPTQAETNFTSFIVTAYKTGCLPASQTIVTSASATSGYAGTDQGKIANPTSTVDLSGTTIKGLDGITFPTNFASLLIGAAGEVFAVQQEGYAITQSSSTTPLLFRMPADGLAPTVVIRKAGGTFAAPAGAVSFIANKLYQVAANATDVGTLGDLELYATAAGYVPQSVTYAVVSFDGQATNLGLSNVTANVQQWSGANVAVPDTAGYPKVTIKSGTGTGEISLSAGLLALIAAYDPAKTAAQAGDAMTLTVGERDAVANALLDLASAVDTYTVRQILRGYGAALMGVLAGAGTTSITIEAADGSKTRITATVDAAGNRSAVVLDLI